MKGLEFRAVFIVGADGGSVPSAQALNAAASKKERSEAERSLFLVALTRAVDRLYISCSGTPGEYLKQLIDCEAAKSKAA